MAPFDHCVMSLRILTNMADPSGVVAAEGAINEYVATIPGIDRKLEALRALQHVMAPLDGPDDTQRDFAELVVGYLAQQISALEELQTPE